MSPEAKAADPRFRAGDQQRVLERVTQMPVGDRDEFEHAGGKSRVIGFGHQQIEIDSVARKYFLREPAGAAAPILPHVFQNVRHLQPLGERHRQALQSRAAARDCGGIVAEELRQHVAHHARDVVAIIVQIAQPRQPAQARGRLETGHSVAHELDAAMDRRALDLVQRSGYADDALHVGDQIPLRRQRAVGEPLDVVYFPAPTRLSRSMTMKAQITTTRRAPTASSR